MKTDHINIAKALLNIQHPILSTLLYVNRYSYLWNSYRYYLHLTN